MRIPLYQIDAFTNKLFHGNPAAVCPLEEWLDDAVLQAIAAENNLSETAFFVKKDKGFHLRWFTPKSEINLCGHATLASAFVIFQFLEKDLTSLEFSTQSGILRVERNDPVLTMDFPATPALSCPVPDALVQGLGLEPKEVLLSRDYMAVYESEAEIRKIQPDMDRLLELNTPGVIITSVGRDADFVSRFFAPGVGIPEDPVTGSAHCTLVPYWSEKLEKTKLRTLQLSEREGELFCENLGNRVKMSGEAVRYMEGVIILC